MEPLRHVRNKEFGAVFFRRNTTQIRNEGGLWDESARLYPLIGGSPKEHDLWWRFPTGASVTFAHLEHDKTVLAYQGSQIPLLCFDELTHFSERQFWYMVSRNRSMCGVRPYIRATCNPDADSWVARFIEWWIDPATGFAIPERGGVLRWFVRVNDTLVWADTPQELAERHPTIPPKSATFVPAKLSDNKLLMEADPGYLANLLALPTVDRERLLGGNWRIRPAAGLYFQRSWCEFIDELPAGGIYARGWDLAATPKTETNDPDWTTGTKVGLLPDGRYVVADHRYMQEGPLAVENALKNTASADGRDVSIHLPQDPGQAGKVQSQHLVRLLDGYDAHTKSVTGDKLTRFKAFSAQAKSGNVLILRAPWNERWLTALEGFPEAAHDDDVDSTSEAFNALHEDFAGRNFYEFARREAQKAASEPSPDPEPEASKFAIGSVEWMKAQAEASGL